jgi:hypothetical protein
MASSPTSPDGWELMLPPIWAIWLGRMSFIMLPVTLFIPYTWWAPLAVLAALVAACNLPHRRPRGDPL